jgi:hypothetical protein
MILKGAGNMVRTQIQLTEEQSEALRRIALKRHLSVAELIRQAVDNLIKTPAALDFKERRKRAMAVAGSFSSGVSDLSKRHDKYLKEAFGK